MLKWIKWFFSSPPVEDSYWTIEYYGLCGRRMVFDTSRAIKDGKFDRQFKAAEELARLLKNKKPSG